MSRKIFVNMAVADPAASAVFYEAIGFTRDARFSNERAVSMTWSDAIAFMLLSHDFYATFTDKRIVDARTSAEVSLCLSQDSRADVDAMTERAIAAGGRETRAAEEHGFMYGRTFEDPDGHIIEPMWMDVDAHAAAMAASATAEAVD